MRVTIELQDEEMGELHVLVENDRLLTPGSHEAPIPDDRDGTNQRRYAVIENAGRDEVVVEPDKLREMEPLSNGRRSGHARSIFGREMTMAYLASPDARQPRWRSTPNRTRPSRPSRPASACRRPRWWSTTTGRIAAGDLCMDNATEQFLEIRLPEGAALWTARVAGEAVKPTEPAGSGRPAGRADSDDQDRARASRTTRWC